MESFAGYQSFRLRQLTGIPLRRICEVAAEVAYETLRNDQEKLRKVMKENSIRTPERQLELDLEHGYEKVID